MAAKLRRDKAGRADPAGRQSGMAVASGPHVIFGCRSVLRRANEQAQRPQSGDGALEQSLRPRSVAAPGSAASSSYAPVTHRTRLVTSGWPPAQVGGVRGLKLIVTAVPADMVEIGVVIQSTSAGIGTSTHQSTTALWALRLCARHRGLHGLVMLPSCEELLQLRIAAKRDDALKKRVGSKIRGKL